MDANTAPNFPGKNESKYHKGGRIHEFVDSDKLNFLVPREKDIEMQHR